MKPTKKKPAKKPAKKKPAKPTRTSMLARLEERAHTIEALVRDFLTRLEHLECEHDAFRADAKGTLEEVQEEQKGARATLRGMASFMSTDRLRSLEDIDRRLGQLERKVPDHINRNLFDPQAKIREIGDDLARTQGETRQRCKDTESRVEILTQRLEALNYRCLTLEAKSMASEQRLAGGVA